MNAPTRINSALSVRDWAPVVSVSRMFRFAITAPGSGGQSKLVLPKRALVPFTTHGDPL